jgi:hypothetical protein
MTFSETTAINHYKVSKGKRIMKSNDLSADERFLLCMLAEEWVQSGPPGYIETRRLASQLGMPRAKAKAIIRSLFAYGWVDSDEVDTFAAYLTPEGYELATLICGSKGNC